MCGGAGNVSEPIPVFSVNNKAESAYSSSTMDLVLVFGNALGEFIIKTGAWFNSAHSISYVSHSSFIVFTEQPLTNTPVSHLACGTLRTQAATCIEIDNDKTPLNRHHPLCSFLCEILIVCTLETGLGS